MTINRRDLIKSGTSALSVIGMSGNSILHSFTEIKKPFPIDDDRIKAITKTAVESSLLAGADYADVRVISTAGLFYISNGLRREESMGCGVRALVNGYWGYAFSPIWSNSEAKRLADEAVSQAVAYNLNRKRGVQLAPISGSLTGEWKTPIEIDPFDVPYDEIRDLMGSIVPYFRRKKFFKRLMSGANAHRTEQVFASSEGHYIKQTKYVTAARFQFDLEDRERGKGASGLIETLSPAGRGWEHIRKQPLRDLIDQEYDSTVKDMEMEFTPVDVGRKRIIVDPLTMVSVLKDSIGEATEADRVFGYEANAGGSSYINEPETMVGTLKIGSEKLNVIANRKISGSPGAAGWDDEGTVPIETSLIENGILKNLQSSRESASWIQSLNSRSTGSVFARSTDCAPMIMCGDLTMLPDAAGGVSIDEMRSQLEDGLEFHRALSIFDFQKATGTIMGKAYEIKNGKRVSLVQNAGVLFRTPELWNNLEKVGNVASVKHFGTTTSKGEPEQSSYLGISVPATTFKDMSIVDIARKA